MKAFALFVSRDALNIEGLSEATLEKFISLGYIREFADIFHLDRYQEEIQSLEGFGEKSYRNLVASAEKARSTTLPRVIYALGIPGVGGVIAKAFVDYFASGRHVKQFRDLLKELVIPEEAREEGKQIFAGVNFVITGSVEHFANRGEIKELIESLGGKVTGSVTSKTNYLINNDVTSTSSKNKKANDLGIPIISEESFLRMVQGQESP